MDGAFKHSVQLNIYVGAIRFVMGCDSMRAQEVISYIQNKKLQNPKETVWFENSEGMHHAAIHANKIVKVEITEWEKGSGVAQNNDGHVAEFLLCYEDGTTDRIQAPHEDRREIAVALQQAMQLKTDVCVRACNVVGSKLIAYTSDYMPNCMCSSEKILSSGCESSRGEQCPARILLPRPSRWDRI